MAAAAPQTNTQVRREKVILSLRHLGGIAADSAAQLRVMIVSYEKYCFYQHHNEAETAILTRRERERCLGSTSGKFYSTEKPCFKSRRTTSLPQTSQILSTMLRSSRLTYLTRAIEASDPASQSQLVRLSMYVAVHCTNTRKGLVKRKSQQHKKS